VLYRDATIRSSSLVPETNGAMVLFFVPEHTLPFETMSGGRNAAKLGQKSRFRAEARHRRSA
jgi:hypothetical protein